MLHCDLEEFERVILISAFPLRSSISARDMLEFVPPSVHSIGSSVCVLHCSWS